MNLSELLIYFATNEGSKVQEFRWVRIRCLVEVGSSWLGLEGEETSEFADSHSVKLKWRTGKHAKLQNL